MLRSFWCAAIAATTLKFLDPFRKGQIVLFAVSYDKVNSSFRFQLEIPTISPIRLRNRIGGTSKCWVSSSWVSLVVSTVQGSAKRISGGQKKSGKELG
jgi:hypothetical protein